MYVIIGLIDSCYTEIWKDIICNEQVNEWNSASYYLQTLNSRDIVRCMFSNIDVVNMSQNVKMTYELVILTQIEPNMLCNISCERINLSYKYHIEN